MSEVKAFYDVDLLGKIVGDITYDDPPRMVKTHCPECGHETGEEALHAASCTCVYCTFDRRLVARAFDTTKNQGKTITEYLTCEVGPA